MCVLHEHARVHSSDSDDQSLREIYGPVFAERKCHDLDSLSSAFLLTLGALIQISIIFMSETPVYVCLTAGGKHSTHSGTGTELQASSTNQCISMLMT